jgi:3-isopropylmalate/(R)-2-methylmalate dehydratase small subunit
MKLVGKARKVGDDINTDYIISSRRKRDTLDGKVLAQYLMEDLDTQFASTINPGDIIVAGKNFGCGSAMEIAALVVKEAGIVAVIAESFSRNFYRNGINNGIFLIVGDTSTIEGGHRIEIIADDKKFKVTDLTTGKIIACSDGLPKIMSRILQEGGLVNYMRNYGSFKPNRTNTK